MSASRIGAEEAFGQHGDLVAERLPALDEFDGNRGMPPTRKGLHGRTGARHGVDIGARRHRADRADHTDPPRDGGRDQRLGARFDDVDDRDEEFVSDRIEAGRGGRIAGDDDRFHVEVDNQRSSQLVGVLLHLGERFRSVRVATGVSDVDEVLGGHEIHQRPGDGEPAES